MAKRGNIFYTDKDFTDLEVQQQFGFPVILILHDNNSVIKKISAFDENGAKSIYDFTLAASKDFVTATIATAISNIKDNTLEFPAFADFPQPGEVGNVYIDLAEDKLYIWDSASNSYISQSWNQAIITGIQSSITSLQNSKLDKPTSTGDYYLSKIVVNGVPYYQYRTISLSSGQIPVSRNTFIGASLLYEHVNGKIGLDTQNPSEKFEVNGRIKSDGLVINETTSAILPKEIKFKDGKFKAALADGVEKAVLLEGDVSGGVDFNALVDIFQFSNFQFIRPNFNATSYFQYNQDGANVFQAGHVAYNNTSTYQKHGIQYKSATTTFGRVHGNFRGFIEKFSYSSFNTSVQFAITSNIATQRVFVGYSDLWRQLGLNPWNAAMNTLVDVIGVCMESGSSNLFIIHNDASGIANLIDTGFTHNTNYLYTLRISKNVNSTTINVVLERVLITTGVKSTFSYDITNNYTPYGAYLAMYCIDALGTTETSIVDFGSLKTKRLNCLV